MWRNELTHYQVDSYFASWSLDGLPNFQKTFWGIKIHWIENFLMLLEKSLKLKCLKWSHMIHLNTYNTSYDQKKGWECQNVNLIPND